MTPAMSRPPGGTCNRLAALTTTLLLVLAASCGRGADGEDPEGVGRGPVILIVVDALRADHLGAYGYGVPTSPNLDGWAERGRVFERAWATSPWTLPSFGSILTGRLPSAHSAGFEVGDGADADFEVVAARKFVKLGTAVPTVAEMLAAEGFATGAFVANPFLDPRFGLDRGFADYDHYDTSNSELRPAAEVVDRSLAWIDNNSGGPFFLLVHLFDPHLDYDAPPPFRGRFSAPLGAGRELPVRGLWPIRNRLDEMPAGEKDFVVAAYDEEVAYVDAELGRFLGQLEARGILQEALVVLTADHGEELFDHGGFEHGHSMFDEVLRVPLILWGPQVEAGRETTPVSLIDVAPTILAASGLPWRRAGGPGDESASPWMPGISLLGGAGADGSDGRDIVAERILYGPEMKAIVNWPYKVILEVATSEVRLFDLAEDPAEQHDLAAERGDTLNTLLGRLSDAISAAEALGSGTEAELDAELLRRLRALGYIR